MPLSQREFLEINADFRAGTPAVHAVYTDTHLTYEALNTRVNRLANALHTRGFRPGDRAALSVTNAMEFVVSLYACHKLGVIALPVNYRLSEGELAAIFNDANVSVVITEPDYFDDDLVENTNQPPDVILVGGSDRNYDSYDEVLSSGSDGAPPPINRDPTDPSYIIYTSGTTGRPKGVVHTTSSARERTIAALNAFEITPQSVVYSQVPYFHGAGLDAAVRPSVTIGGTLIIARDHADPIQTLNVIEEFGVTHVIGIPTITKRVLEQSDLQSWDLSTVECWYHTGEVLPDQTARDFRDRLTPNIINSYGSSEGGFITVLRSGQLTEQAGTVGRPTLGTQIRVVALSRDDQSAPTETVPRGEEGEVIIRSDQLFKGYFQNQSATDAVTREGWYYTSDLGRINHDGFLEITGRVDDIIISGGELIAPANVEAVLERYDGVNEAVVVGVEDADWGERVVAYVDTDREIPEAELDDFCATNADLAAYKRPREYRFIESIEHTESGKKARGVYRDT